MLASDIPIGFFIASADGSFIQVGGKWSELTGMDPLAAVGEGWLDAVHPEDRIRVTDRWQGVVRAGGDLRAQFRFLQPNGSSLWVEAVATRMDACTSGGPGYVGNFLPINTDKAAETRMRIYEAIFSSSPDFACVFSTDYRILFANQSVLDMWGRSWETTAGRTLLEIGYEPGLAERHEMEMLTVAKTRRPLRSEIPFTGTQGLRIYDYIFSPVIGKDGNVEAVASSTRDVTENRRAEEALMQNEVLFTRIIEQSPGGVYVLDENLKLMRANPLAAAVFTAAEPAIGRGIEELMHVLWGEDLGGKFTGIFRHTLETGEHYSTPHFTDRRRDTGETESYGWEARRVTLPSGKHGVVCYFTDVTEQLALENALRASEQRANDIIESITDGFIAISRDWRITYLSERGAEILAPLQKTSDSVLGKVFWDEFPDARGTDIETNFRQAMEEQVTVQFEADYEPLDAWFDLRVYPSVSGVSLFFLDITERKQAEDALRLSQMALAEQADALLTADRRKDQFLATLAHELRNPLAPVLTGIEILRRSLGDPEAMESIMGVIERQTAQMVHLIDDLLDISRVNTGKIVLKKSTASFASMVASAVEATRPLIDERGHALEVLLPPPSMTVEVDSARVAQVISNLLSNAAKYTPPGGSIRLEAGSDGHDAWCKVSDNGLGIDPADQEIIFEIFQQTSNGAADGLGIGLTLVKSLVNLHGGSITVKSAGKSMGSEFEVRLPACLIRTPEAVEVASPDSPIQMKSRRVLVVDDGKNAADILAMFFRMEGMEVEVAYDGHQGLEKAVAFQPDLVLMDLGMPNLDGWEAARMMRAKGVTAIIVALSGWGRAEDKKRTEEAGFNEHLVKPVSPDELRQIMRRHYGDP